MTTQIALWVGAGLLAFGPLLSLFGLIVYHKAQLVIVVTTAAFFFLLASLSASSFWFVLDAIGLRGPISAILPGVFFQFTFRCSFVALYHKVEGVIQSSLERQHAKEEEARLQSSARSDGRTDRTVPGPPRHHGGQGNGNGSNGGNRDKFMESAKLKLALNDASCAVAAGVGYGGMHAVLLYGTLLASQVSNGSGGGILYQDSCPAVPSLAVSAMLSFFFSILDIFWMLFTFFGMRRRLLYHRGRGNVERVFEDTFSVRGGRTTPTSGAGGVVSGAWFGNSRKGGNLALLFVLFTHLIASLLTTANYFRMGCVVSLPAVAAVVLITAYMFWAGVGRIFMPPGFRPPQSTATGANNEDDELVNNGHATSTNDGDGATQEDEQDTTTGDASST